jgi:hypothetical protein
MRTRTVVFIALVTVVLVVAAVGFVELLSVPQERVACVGVEIRGNVSAWYPLSFVAAPFNGSESGKLVEWYNYTVNGTYYTTVTKVPTAAASGNVTVGYATGGNWTIYSAKNATMSGGGPSSPCTSSLLALLGPPNPPSGGIWSGGTVASGLRVDSGLPSSFNASFRCSEFGLPPDCAVSATFNLNFSSPTGNVTTCGRTAPVTLDTMGREMLVDIPFVSNGITYSVPIGASSEIGSVGWFNYTFPADGGIWQYSPLSGVDSSTAGLVFSYSSCP